VNVLVHTPADTVAAITASAAGDCVTIEVSDDGPGIPRLAHRVHLQHAGTHAAIR
jgi:signal transduction histidine kinase